MAEKVSKLSVILSLDSTKFERALGETEKKMKNVGRQLAQTGQDMSLYLSLPLALIGQRITETATEFEYQMARVSAISGATGVQFGKLQSNAERLGASTIFTAREVGQLSEEFAKLGFTADEIVQVTESTLSLAQVTGAALPRAAEVSGAALRTFGLDASKVGEVNDVVAVAISKSALDFESFAETMKYAGSQAAISGISMEELSAAMGVLANTGVKGSIAGTRLRMIFAKLSQEGGNVHDNFIELINSNLTMNEAIERFGIRAATAIPVLQQNREEFFKLEKQMRLSSGTLAIMQETMDDTSFAMQRKLKSALEDVSIQMGKALLPMVNLVAGALTYLANGFASLPPFIHGAIVSFGAIVAAAGPLLLLTGKLLQILPTLTLVFPKLAAAITFLTGPWGLLIAGVAALSMALYAAIGRSEKMAAMTERLADASKAASQNAVEGTSKIKLLIEAYNNENRTMEEKQDILDKLMELQPDYFKELDANKTKVADLKTAYDELFKSMLKQETAKAFMAEINKLEQQRIQALIEQDKIRPGMEQTQTNLDAAKARQEETGGTGSILMGTSSGTAITDTENILKRQKGLMQDQQDIIDEAESQIKQIGKLMEGQGLDALLGNLTGSGSGAGQPVESGVDPVDFSVKATTSEKALTKLGNALSETAVRMSVLGMSSKEVAEEKLKAFESALGALITASSEGESVGNEIAYIVAEMGNLQTEIDALTQSEDLDKIFKKMNEGFSSSKIAIQEGAITPLEDAKNRMKATKDALDALTDAHSDQASTIARLRGEYALLVDEVKKLTEAERLEKLQKDVMTKTNEAIIQGSMDIGKALGQVAASGEDAGKAMLEASTSALSALITQLYLLYAKSVMTSATIPDPIAKLAALGIGAGILSGFVANIPKMAQGGIAVGEQLVTVGDNRSGREAIIPLEKLPSMMEKMGAGGNNRVYGSLRGEDIHLSSMRGARMQQRII